MSLVLVFIRRWHKSFRVLRYHNGFGMLDSVRYGLWLAHSWPEGTARMRPQ